MNDNTTEKAHPKIFEQRATYSHNRLAELQDKISDLADSDEMEDLAIFCAGSFARGEASSHSDLDLFFVRESSSPNSSPTPHTDELRLLGRLIEIAVDLGFPSFTDDGKYLTIHNVDDIANELGSPSDDYHNYFTLRMLMLLESKCIFGEEHYDSIKKSLLEIYYRDYHDHPLTFRPTFLLNDISRFWKTLLLNYENGRHESKGDSEAQRIKAKVKNFKLKFSRMTTCFATIAAVGSYPSPVDLEPMLGIMNRTPQERLDGIVEQHETLAPRISALREQYSWFLTHTQLSTEDLHANFQDKIMRNNMFDKAERYRWTMIDLLHAIDQLHTENASEEIPSVMPGSRQRGLIDTLIV